ncbi:MAG: biotin synthase BioB [Nitrospiraceae bacterium]|nr:MAG: biotin synthase BioB [Nitrospiraceae bacterium]
MFQTAAYNCTYNQGIDKKTAYSLISRKDAELFDLFALANRVRIKCRGNKVDLCSIVNAKSGACPEDCSFCAQSAHNDSGSKIYPLIDRESILEAAREAQERGVRRFCVVTSGKSPTDNELDEICGHIYALKKTGMSPCATLGMLDPEQLKRLKRAGLHRYHHNLETSEAFFSEICTTHTYDDKIRTIRAAKSAGLSICSGGIFGLGESWEDRIEMAFALKEAGVDSVPVNFLTPVDGTPMGSRELMEPLEALKVIAIYRLILPDTEIRVCGGRPATLRSLHALIFTAGADGMLLGNYLTTAGRSPDDDVQMINDLGLVI